MKSELSKEDLDSARKEMNVLIEENSKGLPDVAVIRVLSQDILLFGDQALKWHMVKISLSLRFEEEEIITKLYKKGASGDIFKPIDQAFLEGLDFNYQVLLELQKKNEGRGDVYINNYEI